MSNWISVEARMPHIGDDVLVYMPRAHTKQSVERVYRGKNDNPKFHKGWNKGESEFEVTHWMPLPKAPVIL